MGLFIREPRYIHHRASYLSTTRPQHRNSNSNSFAMCTNPRPLTRSPAHSSPGSRPHRLHPAPHRPLSYPSSPQDTHNARPSCPAKQRPHSHRAVCGRPCKRAPLSPLTLRFRPPSPSATLSPRSKEACALTTSLLRSPATMRLSFTMLLAAGCGPGNKIFRLRVREDWTE